MASQCKKQQCSIDRRGFRQELDSWRHKLIHCVGFESILEGLFGTELEEDLKFFKDLGPVAVSDWSFEENCLFCCLRRDKVKEHLIGKNKEGLEDGPQPLLVKDQTTINRLEKQAEEFLNAVLYRKDVPNFSDPHIPVVAREILQKMIRKFAAEYTSKTSSPQDSCSESQPHTDQSLPAPPLLTGAPATGSPAPALTGSAQNQNPVLSKLLMADQDVPLDLTIKKPPPEPCDQDGVLDLSIKKNRYSSNVSVYSPCVSPLTSTIKGPSLRTDGQVGLFMKSLQDGMRRENIGHSNHYKPTSSFAYSLHVKEEVDAESIIKTPLGENQGSAPNGPLRNGISPCNFKASENLKEISKLLEAGFLIHSLNSEKGNFQGPCVEQTLSLSHSSRFDLKIPQVRVVPSGMDTSWDSLSPGNSGSSHENAQGKKPFPILPQEIHKKSSRGPNSSGLGSKYWPCITNHQALVENYSLDTNGIPSNPLNGRKDDGKRKKRGRYRQYNTELLEEAIVLVMGGKMSVSKAQSIYGIPHSTLEYKVKERLGTLKNPPKKKLKLSSQTEDKGCVQYHDGTTQQECQIWKSTLVVNGSDGHDGSLSSND